MLTFPLFQNGGNTRIQCRSCNQLSTIVLENDRIWWLPAGTTKSAWTSSLLAPRGIFSTRKNFNLLYFPKVILKAGEKLPNSSDYLYLISFNLIYFIFFIIIFIIFFNFCHFLAARSFQLAARSSQLAIFSSLTPHIPLIASPCPRCCYSRKLRWIK